MQNTNQPPLKPIVNDILKTEGIIRFDAEQTLSQAQNSLSSSHDAAFVFDGDKFIGVVSPYYILKSRSLKEHSKLKTCVMMPKKLHLGDHFSEVAKAMINTKIHYLPAVDDNGDFVGIVSLRRMLGHIVKNKLMKNNGTIIFSDRDLVTTSVDMKVSQVLALMKNEKIARLPVVNGDDRLVGIISQYDLNNVMNDQNTVGRFDKRGEKENFHNESIKNYMVKLVETIDHVPSFTEAARIMLDKKLGSLLIVDANNSPISIITKRDILNTVAQNPGL